MFQASEAVISVKHRLALLPYNKDIERYIPTAKRGIIRGTDLLILPHTVETTVILRNEGIICPSPILYQYSWGGITPFEAQRVTAAMLAENSQAFVLNEMATGKTLSSLFAFDFLRQQGLAQKMLVVAPLSTLEDTWLTEVNNRMPHLEAQVLHGTASNVNAWLSSFTADIGIINHDGLTHRLDALMKVPWDVLCIDELTAFKNATATRTKHALRLANTMYYRWGMTGTPTPQGPLDAYGQIRLIRPGNMAMSYKAWETITTEQVSTFKRVPRKNAKDEVFKRMQPAVRFKRSDVVELPPVTHIWRSCKMSDRQKAIFNEVSKKLKAQVSEGLVTAMNEASKRQKLLQISSGFVYVDGKTSDLQPTDRINTVLEAVEQANGKFLIFPSFVAGVEMLAKALKKAGYNAPAIHGGVSQKMRREIFHAFRNDPDTHGIVAHPGTMSHGLNLTEADLIVWPAPPNSLEVYLQANARISRPGQTRKQIIVHVSGSWLEDEIYKRLKTNNSSQVSLLELFSP